MQDQNPNPLHGEADAEYQTRIDAQRVTLEWSQKIQNKPVDFADAPLWNPNEEKRQRSLF